MPARLGRQARRELRRLLPGAGGFPHIAGNIIATPAGELDEALATLAEETTFTLAHVTPVELRVPVGAGEITAGAGGGGPPPARPEARAQLPRGCDRRGDHDFSAHEVELALADVFMAGGRPPVICATPSRCCRWRSSRISPSWDEPGDPSPAQAAARMRIWAPGERPISRAELKLREALERFALELPPDGRALDVGRLRAVDVSWRAMSRRSWQDPAISTRAWWRCRG